VHANIQHVSTIVNNVQGHKYQTLLYSLLGRPTQPSAGWGFTTILLSPFSSANLWGHSTELNQNLPRARKCAIWKRMSKIWGTSSKWNSTYI